ncbi:MULTISPECIES: hypothetical protein [Zobellia]|uniref:DUF2185 domain-containing protein n=1 Tax=Zobellia galactanivorans (strain DSM 12802 / CCUG 47099 / CIP 106680 / NCIMB 13871 / Dsij) TaxID=63186 RepID=G0L317_ZOBGA|nr:MULTISPECIES: hypothetical protein [Zobellia]MBU3024980.1 hypothetical protein [Zobellia galactanivorans]OWW25694.1 hypothetical protein B4Q04_08810 [Zobellia sp. OII3]CAZ98329.1 Putative protein [Zobellia galactanivorans]
MSLFNLFGKGKNDQNKPEFKFNDPENKAVFTCNHVVDEKCPILYASHDTDGDWQFLCGGNDHTEENAKLISLKNAVELDNTLNELFEMPIGVGAERNGIGGKWEPFRL